jgi:hypothetical protein
VDVLQTLSTLWAMSSGDWRDEGFSNPAIYFRCETSNHPKMSVRGKEFMVSDSTIKHCHGRAGPNPNANFVSRQHSLVSELSE